MLCLTANWPEDSAAWFGFVSVYSHLLNCSSVFPVVSNLGFGTSKMAPNINVRCKITLVELVAIQIHSKAFCFRFSVLFPYF